MALMMIDIDRFKHINDAHGHAVGDEAIIAVVETILSASRGSDALGRFGGDEFVLLLPQTTLEHALVVAEKIRKVIAAAPVELDAGSGFAITVSIGVTQVQPADVSVHDALLRIDEAMYAAKAAGRGCVMARP
jgi:diguanylate cyclase (GGDEF)-like protein